jgi:hypothetical protein
MLLLLLLLPPPLLLYGHDCCFILTSGCTASCSDVSWSDCGGVPAAVPDARPGRHGTHQIKYNVISL